MTAFEKWPEPRPVRLTIEDFLRLDEAGAFREYAKTELIEGQIVAMNAQFSQHAHVKSMLLRRIADAAERVLLAHNVWSEVSVAIPPDHLPEPDVVVTSFVPGRRAPVPVETVPLLVEVSDTTLRYDLGIKRRLYASGGVPEYWVADLEARRFHRMWSPEQGGYAEADEIDFGRPLASVTISRLVIETGGL